MDLIFSILLMMGRILVETLTSPLFIFIYLLLFLVVSWQYKRMERLSEQIFNVNQNNYLQSALISAITGLVGGLIGSCLIILLGIDLANIGIAYLWVIAIALMFINPRFLCFAYAGGLLSIFSLITGHPNISIPQLMGLVAALHMVESALILLNGHLNPIPVTVLKRKSVRGGFNLQKFWPIPLVALVSAGYADPITAGVAMPDWWPLLKGYTEFTEGKTYTLLPVLAILGYGEISTTNTPAKRVKKSAIHLFLFSLVLLVLAVASSNHRALIILVALYSPLGHELIIWLGMREEKNQRPIYTKPSEGVMVLAVKNGSLAYKTGIKSRDIILGLNGVRVDNEYIMHELLVNLQGTISINLKRNGTYLNLETRNETKKNFGIIAVPELNACRYISLADDSIFNTASHVWRKMKTLFNRLGNL